MVAGQLCCHRSFCVACSGSGIFRKGEAAINAKYVNEALEPTLGGHVGNTRQLACAHLVSQLSSNTASQRARRTVIRMEMPRGKELTKFLTEKLDELADNICQDPDQLSEFIERWSNGFHSYSINNTILAWMQCPDFTLLAGFKAWQKRGRQVRKGERAIRILAPMTRKIIDDDDEETVIIRGFRPVSVFDVSQTEGDPVDVGCSDLISGNVDWETIVKACPLPVHIKDLGLSNGNTNGKEINIAPKENTAAMCATLIHEWAHVALGHCKEQGILYETDEISAREIEAETAAYIVTTCLGLENNKSRLYIANWGAEKEELKGLGKKIISVSEKIIRDINSLS